MMKMRRMYKNYIVSPEQKVVVATMDRKTGCPSVRGEVKAKCSRETSKVVNSTILSKYGLDINIANTAEELSFKGVAKCLEGDEFNERIGREIASSKVDMKYHTVMAKKYEMLMKLYSKAIEELKVLHGNHIEKMENIKSDMDRCYKGVE